jgi:gas vesicle protein
VLAHVGLAQDLQEIHMALPFFPLLIGAAVGAAATYILMTKKDARNRITNAAQDLTDTVEAKAGKVTSAVSDAMEDATKVVKDAASKVTK